MTVPEPQAKTLNVQTAAWQPSNRNHALNTFAGSCAFFSYRLQTVVHTHAGDTAVTAVFSNIQLPQGPRDVANPCYRCVVEVHGSANSATNFSNSRKIVLGPKSCLVDTLGPDSAFAITFPTACLGPQDYFSAQHAKVKVELAPLALPSKLVSLTSATAFGTLATLNDPDMSDCAIVPKDSDKPIHVSRAILARASPFFFTMFKGAWTEFLTLDMPIEFGWSASALLSCLLHMYSGWVIGEPLPADGGDVKCDGGTSLAEQLCAKYKVDFTTMSPHQLLELSELARMLDLPALTAAASAEAIKVLTISMEDAQVEAKGKMAKSGVSRFTVEK